jgi:alcohol dehydrogenase class IV
MKFHFFMPTKVYLGTDCIKQNMAEFGQWGKRAFVVTGRNSARVSGALADVTSVLEQQGIDYQVFDQIEENPSLAVVEAGGQAALQFKPDVVIGIGGGSPLDAAKAIAALAVNNIAARDLYDGGFAMQPLPLIAVPITAGTGSEVTPYSILTDDERQTKRSFAHPGIFPKIAFLDARYTQTQSWEVTVNSAVDALSHAVEGYLSRKSTSVTDCLALEAIRTFGSVQAALLSGELQYEHREKLLYASLLGGMVIAQTATTAVHALGYSLTYFCDVPHGRANGLLMGEYLRFNETAVPEKISNVLQQLSLTSIDEFKTVMTRLLPSSEVYSEQEIIEFAGIAGKSPNTANTPRQPDINELQQLLRSSLPVRS